jgi:hypothetical protein
MRLATLVGATTLLACGSDATTPETEPGPTWADAFPLGTDPFADRVESFEPALGASFGHEDMPEVVLGQPEGRGASAGSMDVASLGEGGSLVLALEDLEAVDGDGPDLIVFENPFPAWIETGEVSASEDGVTWYTWTCDPVTYAGCAGVAPVYANSDNDIDPTDPEVAGGDAFDLADLGLARARFVRIQDSGANDYTGVGAGFDLDAVAVVNWQAIDE